MNFVAIGSFLGILALFAWVYSKTSPQRGFLTGIFRPDFRFPANWDSADEKLLVTALVFAGLGGLWNILYASWVRSEGLGMARLNNDEFLEYQEGWKMPAETAISKNNYRRNMRRITIDLFVGILANFVMLLMLAYIAYAAYPKDTAAPQNLGIITSLADSFAINAGGLWWCFYFIIGIFLLDTWITAADSLSKVFANFLVGVGPKADDNVKVRTWYIAIVTVLFIMTIVSSFLAQPQQLIFFNGIMSGFGSVILVIGLLFNERSVRGAYPWLPRHSIAFVFLIIALVAYLVLGGAYIVGS